MRQKLMTFITAAIAGVFLAGSSFCSFAKSDSEKEALEPVSYTHLKKEFTAVLVQK